MKVITIKQPWAMYKKNPVVYKSLIKKNDWHGYVFKLEK